MYHEGFVLDITEVAWRGRFDSFKCVYWRPPFLNFQSVYLRWNQLSRVGIADDDDLVAIHCLYNIVEGISPYLKSAFIVSPLTLDWIKMVCACFYALHAPQHEDWNFMLKS